MFAHGYVSFSNPFRSCEFSISLIKIFGMVPNETDIHQAVCKKLGIREVDTFLTGNIFTNNYFPR